MEFQRESIFISALRSFFRMFFAICGIFIAFMVMSYAYSLVGESTTSPTEPKTKINYLPDAKGNRESSLTSPVILQLNIDGVIGDPKHINTANIEHALLDSRTGTLKDGRVKGILLYMNTPGGTVVDSDNIYRMLKQYKERYSVPIYAYVDGMCASGGMYIASSADQIYAGPASAIGSVGVIIGPFFNIFDALGKIGVTPKVITEGIDKDMMSPFRPWKTDEDASLKALTAYFYEHFVNVVTEARPRLNKTKLINEYGAKIFDPVTAESLGYIDFANSTRNTALTDLLKKANIDPNTTYQVIELEPKSEFLSSLFNTKSPIFTGKIEHTFDTGMPLIRDKFAYLYVE